jgi:isoleucyl-tRNA synthetase
VAPATEAQRELLERAGAELLEMIWIVSQVTIGTATGRDWQIHVSKAAGTKCPRCWRWQTDVGLDAAHPELCGRCARVVTELAAGGVGNS